MNSDLSRSPTQAGRDRTTMNSPSSPNTCACGIVDRTRRKQSTQTTGSTRWRYTRLEKQTDPRSGMNFPSYTWDNKLAHLLTVNHLAEFVYINIIVCPIAKAWCCSVYHFSFIDEKTDYEYSRSMVVQPDRNITSILGAWLCSQIFLYFVSMDRH